MHDRALRNEMMRDSEARARLQGALRSDALGAAAERARRRRKKGYVSDLDYSTPSGRLQGALRADSDALYQRDVLQPRYCEGRTKHGEECQRMTGRGRYAPRTCWQH